MYYAGLIITSKIDAPMPSARYKFVRKNDNIEGFLSKNRASTDALNALTIWLNSNPQRSYIIVNDEDEQILVDLSWSETDISAGECLEDACNKFGIERSYLQT